MGSMYHQGTLQSGIALALGSQKLVACLVVKDEDAESQKWEQEWFGETDSQTTFAKLLAANAVVLRLLEGSDEAGFLSAFCPIDEVPQLVVISNGSVVLNIRQGIDQQVASQKLSAILPSQQPPHADTVHESSPSPNESVSSASNGQTSGPSRLGPETTNEEAEDDVSEVAKKPADKGKQREQIDDSSTLASRRTWLEEQRTRKQEARQEKAAILQKIENDKLARKAKAQPDSAASSDQKPTQAEPSRPAPTVSSSDKCSLQIRLFDGSSIRSRFGSESTLSTAVRTFVSENAGDQMPYNFRLMDLPRPTRTIEVSEEGQTLRELGLCPSATLVLVPVKDFTEAYASSGVTGIVRKGLNLGVNATYGVFGLLGGAITSVTGYGGSSEGAEGPYIAGTGDVPADAASRREGEATGSSNKSGIRISTLADKRKQDDTQFYNGNQLSVEPRPDDK